MQSLIQQVKIKQKQMLCILTLYALLFRYLTEQQLVTTPCGISGASAGSHDSNFFIRCLSADEQHRSITSFRYWPNSNNIQQRISASVFEDNAWRGRGTELKSFSCIGNLLLEQDAYGVSKSCSYDDFGNIELLEVSGGIGATREVISSSVVYDEPSAHAAALREHIVEHTSFAGAEAGSRITTSASFNAPFGTLNSVKSGSDGAKTVFSYDSLNRLTGVSRKESSSAESGVSASNGIGYNSLGYIGSVTDNSGLKFGFGYDIFGNIDSYSVEGDGVEALLMLEKVYEHSEDTSSVVERVYSANDTVASTASSNFDRHGRLTSMNNREGADNVSVTSFLYQSSNESPSVAPLSAILDPLGEQNYLYRYNLEDNTACGYSIFARASNGSSNAQLLNITQTAAGRTRYTFTDSDTIETEIETDKDILQRPRVRATKLYLASNLPDWFRDWRLYQYGVEYHYDRIGRLQNKRSGTSESLQVISTLPGISGAVPSVTFSDWDTNYSYKAGSNAVTGVFSNFRDNTAPVPANPIIGGFASVALAAFLASRGTRRTNYRLHTEYDYSVDGRSNITRFIESSSRITEELAVVSGKQQVVSSHTHFNITHRREYRYDTQNRVTHESILSSHPIGAVVDGNIGYVYNSIGNVIQVLGGSNPRHFTYDALGRLVNDGNVERTYDNFGNVTQIGTKALRWERGNLLSSVGNISFKYNHQGVRVSKSVGNNNVTYFYDGSKLLGEDRSNGVRLRYVYDATGLIGIRRSDSGSSIWLHYIYTKDALGNITGIVESSSLFEGQTPICRYFYDAWGNVSIRNPDGSAGNFGVNHISNVNPFRWKSHYADTDLNWYYIDGRWYDPFICGYVSVDRPENLLSNSTVPGALNRYGITIDNPVALVAAIYSIYTATLMYADVNFSPHLTRWERALIWFNEASPWIQAGVILVSLLVFAMLALASKGALVKPMLKGALKGALIGAAVGATVSGMAAYMTGGCVGTAMLEGAARGALNGAAIGIIGGGLAGVKQYLLIKKAKGMAGTTAPETPGAAQPQPGISSGADVSGTQGQAVQPFSTKSTNPHDYLAEALRQQGLTEVPAGGLKQSWTQDGFKFEVRAHAGNPEHTTAKMIFRVSRKPIYTGVGQGAGTSYLAIDGIWYHTSVLKPSSLVFNNWAAANTHISLR